MQGQQVHTDRLCDKIQRLPPEKVAVVDDFVNFLESRIKDDNLVKAAGKLSEASFLKTWDNPEDAEYDNL
jgi:hypothetical protein